MARRRQRNLIELPVIIGLLATLAVLGVLVPLMLSRVFLAVVFFVAIIGIVLLAIAAIPITFAIARRLQQTESRRTLLEKSKEIVDGKIGPLVRSRAQLVRQDAYGLWQTEKWEKEKSRFVAQHIQPSLNLNECKVLQSADTSIRDMIEARVEEEIQRLPVFQNFSDEMTPTEFEMFCAEELRQAGWNANASVRRSMK